MGDELRVPSATLGAIRSELATGRTALEDTASSSPRAIDAGEMTAMLTAMMSKVIDNAATVSESLGGVSGQVAEAGSNFWETDADVASSYAGTR